MPYELSCPSCGVVVASSFVRVGAVVVCGRCGHKYRIAGAHVKRRVGALAGGGGGASADALVGEAEMSTEELVRRAADGHVVGLSGLSEMMQHEPTPPRARASQAPPAARAVSAGGDGGRGRTARALARRRNSRVVYALFGGLGLVMAAIGCALWWAVMSGGLMVELPPPDPDRAGRHPTPAASVYESLPLLYAQPLRIAPWEPVGGPYTPPPRDAEAWLVDQARVFTGSAEEHFVASVVTESPDIIVAAMLRLVLVDSQGDALAQTHVPVAMFGAGRRHRVRVALPDDLPDGLLRVDARVDPQERLVGGVYLTQTGTAPLPGPSGNLLLSAVNPTDQPLSRLVFLLTAADDRDRPIARWRVELTQPVDPGGRARVRVVVTQPVPDDAHWIVEAAGK